MARSIILAAAAVTVNPCNSFIVPSPLFANIPLYMTSSARQEPTIESHDAPLDPITASDFTIQVCTSTNCSKRLQTLGLDQYHVLGEIYARAQERNVEKCMIIEDGACQGGRNCRLGPCVGILHSDFDGNVALEGMNSSEFRERV